MDLGPIAWVAAGMALVMGASELPRLAGHHTFSRPGVAADVLMSACMAAMVCPATEGMFIAVGWWPVLFVLAGVACAAAGARQAVRPDHRHGERTGSSTRWPAEQWCAWCWPCGPRTRSTRTRA